MRIFWASPFGAGWSIAEMLRNAGNKVVYFNPSGNKNGLGFLPEADSSSWLYYARKADLIVVDDNFTSRPTRRSYEPSDFIQQLAGLRAHGVQYIGPTPTTELLEWDTRYLRKTLARVGLSVREVPLARPKDIEQQPLVISRDPDGGLWLVIRSRHDGLNLGDVVLPISSRDPLCQQLEPLHRFLDSVKCSTYVNVDIEVGPQQLNVRGVQCRFLYPAIFVQLGSLLRGLDVGHLKDQVFGGVATTLLAETKQHPFGSTQGLNDLPGFFGLDLHRESDGAVLAHGPILGAHCRIGPIASGIDALECEVRQLGMGMERINHVIHSLQVWGWLLGP